MTDTRRMTTDRFYGGVDRLQNLHAMLTYIRDEQPSRDDLTQWVIEHTSAKSPDAVSHHLTFLDSIELIVLSETKCKLGDYGHHWLDNQDPKILYEALDAGVKGFDTILKALQDGPLTDEGLMDLLVDEFQEAEMTKPGPAIRHREWLQVLGFVDRKDGANHLTVDGRGIIETDDTSSSPEFAALHTLPENVSIGDRLSQEAIEEVFDTGFGYQISGINPRRDSQDRRYVLVFANEDGPYDDTVTQGRFEYIGEGLEGNQSESSPGNSVLIDTISSDIPVHFFYQHSGGGGWEYQGFVEVLGREFREQDGRDVIVFEMEHQNQTTELSWLEAMREELRQYHQRHSDPVVTLDQLYAFSENRLATQFPNNDNARPKIRQQLQYLRDEGDVEFLDNQGTYRITIGDDIEEAKTELERALEVDPVLTEDTDEYTESRRRTRDQAFVDLVKETYDQTCAFCGSSRETPVGNPEVEAAHIYPRGEGGADDIRNGIALCKLHHWAFDTGWLSISDEHMILVRDVPERDGYYEFKQLEGDSISPPDEKQAGPHPKFLEKHRQIHGFTNR